MLRVRSKVTGEDKAINLGRNRTEQHFVTDENEVRKMVGVIGAKD